MLAPTSPLVANESRRIAIRNQRVPSEGPVRERLGEQCLGGDADDADGDGVSGGVAAADCATGSVKIKPTYPCWFLMVPRSQLVGGEASARQDLDPTVMQRKCHAPVGAPRRMKRVGAPLASRRRGQYEHRGLALRASESWCPEPVTKVDLETVRHQGLLPA